MIGSQSLRLALKGLSANLLRSALTMLGIIIGVGSVIVLVAVGTGSSQKVQKQIEALGTNTILVQRGGFFAPGSNRTGASRRVDLTLADVRALEDPTAAPSIKSVSPAQNAQATVSFEGKSYNPQRFVGTTPSEQEAGAFKVAEGNWFSQDDVDQSRKTVVLGQTVAENVFSPGVDPLGAVVKVNGVQFTVVGVLATKGSAGPLDQDDVAFAPITAVQDSLTGRSGSLSSLTVEAKSRSVMTQAQNEITQILGNRHPSTNGTANFSVLNQATLLQTSNDSNQVFTVLLGVVAGISLLVGGIGVMNIMLVTVTERTREIGIRKAIGASRRDILSQFVLEAVVVSVLGGLVGIGAGLIGSQFRIIGIDPVVAPYSVGLAFGVAVIIGLFFGIYPANRAARLRPIDALRYE